MIAFQHGITLICIGVAITGAIDFVAGSDSGGAVYSRGSIVSWREREGARASSFELPASSFSSISACSSLPISPSCSRACSFGNRASDHHYAPTSSFAHCSQVLCCLHRKRDRCRRHLCRLQALCQQRPRYVKVVGRRAVQDPFRSEHQLEICHVLGGRIATLVRKVRLSRPASHLLPLSMTMAALHTKFRSLKMEPCSAACSSYTLLFCTAISAFLF
jgi:hypothetical protein